MSDTTAGLLTPHLNSEENETFHDAENTEEATTTPTKAVSTFEIANEIQDRLKSVLEVVDNQEKEINERIDKLLERVSKLENEL